MTWNEHGWTDEVVITQCAPQRRDVSKLVHEIIKSREKVEDYGDLPVIYTEICFADYQGNTWAARKRTRDGVLSQGTFIEMAKAINEHRASTLRLEDFEITYSDGLRN